MSVHKDRGQKRIKNTRIKETLSDAPTIDVLVKRIGDFLEDSNAQRQARDVAKQLRSYGRSLSEISTIISPQVSRALRIKEVQKRWEKRRKGHLQKDLARDLGMSETQIRRYAKSDPASAFFVPPKYRRRLVDLDDCDPEKRAYLLGTYFSVQSKGSKTKYARTTSSLQ